MTDCKHKRTAVFNSRAVDAKHINGSPLYGELPFNSLVMRRRKCLDCGFRFGTYEIEQEEMLKIVAASTKDSRTIIKGAILFLQSQL